MLAVAVDEHRDAKNAWDDMGQDARARRLEEALAHQGLTQTDLMKKLDVSWTTVNRWVRAHAPISWARWLSICSAIGISPDWKPDVKPAKKKNA